MIAKVSHFMLASLASMGEVTGERGGTEVASSEGTKVTSLKTSINTNLVTPAMAVNAQGNNSSPLFNIEYN